MIAGWDAAAFSFLLLVWPIILRADSSHAAQLATREDESRGSARCCWWGRAWPACWAPGWYQVSDTTVRDPQIRRIMLVHAFVSYLFGVVVVGGCGQPHRRTDPLISQGTDQGRARARRVACGATLAHARDNPREGSHG